MLLWKPLSAAAWWVLIFSSVVTGLGAVYLLMQQAVQDGVKATIPPNQIFLWIQLLLSGLLSSGPLYLMIELNTKLRSKDLTSKSLIIEARRVIETAKLNLRRDA